MTPVPLSILDLSPISSGGDAATALRNTVELAQHGERLGFRRFWIAERVSSGIDRRPRVRFVRNSANFDENSAPRRQLLAEHRAPISTRRARLPDREPA